MKGLVAFGTALVTILLLMPEARSEQNTIVIGPSNVDLADGAQELLAGNAREGVDLTLRGLSHAAGKKEREAALSNLCAGFIMLNDLDAALRYCNLLLSSNDRHWRGYNNRALIYVMTEEYEKAEQDIKLGQELNPNARTLKVVKSMLLDKTHPVAPNIIIDDRRRKTVGEAEKEGN